MGRPAFSPDGGRLAVPIGDVVIVWDLRLIRAQLAGMGLDWDAPPIPTGDPAEPTATPLRVRVAGADWFAAAFEGSAHAAAGRWEAAAAAYARAVALGADDPEVWYRALLLRLRAGDLSGYRAGCATLLDRFGHVDRGANVNNMAWTFALGPDALTNWTALVGSVERAANQAPRDVALRNTLGAVLLRAGRPEEATRALEESIRLQGHGGNAFDWLFLAMARHRLGRAEEAKAALETARDWIAHGDERAGPDPYIPSPLPWSTRLEIEVLAREAAALVNRPTTGLPDEVFAPR
jgi:tetratricopeptide (TPR) repeat protein